MDVPVLILLKKNLFFLAGLKLKASLGHPEGRL